MCGNRFQQVDFPINIDEFYPVLVGRPDGNGMPRLWISAPAGRTHTSWHALVEDNVATHDDVEVHTSPRRILVDFKSFALLTLELRGQVPRITNLDLRPVGLSINGDRNGLYLAGNRISGSRFANMQTAIGFSSAP